MRTRRRTGLGPAAWLGLGTDLAMLGVEAQMVIGERIAMLMVGGPKARREAERMVSEKIRAAGNAAVTLALGGTPRKVVRGYRRKVRANHRRLSKA
ncbi:MULTISPECIES: hypothetical protein [Methylobacterium]|jgi:hypothetical protein|uniref:Uncharacterized protein n=1 Tax=Methylobacterium longum TaxID=767694 RepID=A0ABT8AYI5_9HYPH|nr:MULTISPECIES: hypothetical protein [Methylobacterium]MCJ2102528.1 hypothetical protein [Methylobacterium sp. E-046]MDN3574615.1 hypothetical protein [Methylobacterium longum]GJE10395.1 hypothetical protein FOHLNKBM_1428 [Methylobacterium longum]